MVRFDNVSIDELSGVSEKIISLAEDQRIFAFYGKMGAGKTTLIKEMCKVLGVEDVVCSPTFAIVNEYIAEAEKIFHFDFYRLKNSSEAFDIGYEDYFYSGNYCLIEWPEKISELLPKNYVKIQIEEDDTNGNRIIIFEII